MARKSKYYSKKKAKKRDWGKILIILVVLVIAGAGWGIQAGYLQIPTNNPNPGPSPSGQVTVQFGIIDGANGGSITGAQVYYKVQGSDAPAQQASETSGTYSFRANIGQTMVCMAVKAGYNPAIFVFTVGEGDSNSIFDPTVNGTVFSMYKIATSVTMSLLVAPSSAYNSTAGTLNKTILGNTATLSINIQVASDDTVLGGAYTNLLNGSNYVGPLFVIKADTTKVTVTSVSSATVYKTPFTIGSYTYYVYTFSQLVYDSDNYSKKNNPSINLQVQLNFITTGNNVLSFYTYNSVYDQYIAAGNFGTAAASIADLDIVS